MPLGAKVIVRGNPVGKTPLALERNPGPAVELALVHAGYETARLEEAFERSRTRSVTLQPEARPGSAALPAKAPTAPSRARPRTRPRKRPHVTITPKPAAPAYSPTRIRDFKKVEP